MIEIQNKNNEECKLLKKNTCPECDSKLYLTGDQYKCFKCGYIIKFK